MHKIREWHDVDRDMFQQEIVAQNEPAVLRSLVGEWPVVRQAKISPAALASYLSRFDRGKELPVFIGSPAIKGRFSYQENFRDFNFGIQPRTLEKTLRALIELVDISDAPAVAMQSATVDDNFPGFDDENQLSLFEKPIQPRIWLGNRTVTATHYDTRGNVACAVAGRRQWTLFPPEQIANLYVGPLLHTPGGAPISMVDIREPDFSRYPNFKNALAAAQRADLEAGDAIYVPSYWWHNVESMDAVSMQVNYWWGESDRSQVTPHQSLLHSLLTIPKLSLEQRKVWQVFFDYYVFRIDQDPTAHLPDDLQDIIGNLSPERTKRVMKQLSEQLDPDEV